MLSHLQLYGEGIEKGPVSVAVVVRHKGGHARRVKSKKRMRARGRSWRQLVCQISKPNFAYEDRVATCAAMKGKQLARQEGRCRPPQASHRRAVIQLPVQEYRQHPRHTQSKIRALQTTTTAPALSACDFPARGGESCGKDSHSTDKKHQPIGAAKSPFVLLEY